MHRFACAQPDDTQYDKQRGWQQGADQPADRPDFGEQVAAPQGDQCGNPIQHDDYHGHVYAVVAQRAGTEYVRQAYCDKGDLNRVPHHVLDPLQPDGHESSAIAEGFAHPYVYATFPAGGEFGGDQCRGHEEEHCGNQIEQYRGQAVIRHCGQ